MSTLGTILKDNWQWRGQIWHLALFELKKQSRGAALGWVWFLVKPMVYVLCFWFALDVGLRAARTIPLDNGGPYLLWLASGIFPWFFMTKMLHGGIDVLRKHSYLVSKVKFPISAISHLFTLASFIQQLMIQGLLLVVYFAYGQPLDIHLLQVPVLLVLMYVFWFFFSVLMSPLCAMSRDVKNFMGSLSTPFFWLSGVIFNVRDIPYEWAQTLLYFNPITFFVTAFRDAYYYRVWIWEDPMLCIGFAITFAVTVAAAVLVYKRTNEGVADAF